MVVIMDLSNVFIQEIKEQMDVTIPQSYYQNTDIVSLPTFTISLEILKDNNQDYFLLINSDAKMGLKDALTLDVVDYPFSLNIEEKITDDNEMLVTTQP